MGRFRYIQDRLVGRTKTRQSVSCKVDHLGALCPSSPKLLPCGTLSGTKKASSAGVLGAMTRVVDLRPISKLHSRRLLFMLSQGVEFHFPADGEAPVTKFASLFKLFGARCQVQ